MYTSTLIVYISAISDMNECSQSPAKCGEGQTCENYPGTYRCRCNNPGTYLVNGSCEGAKNFLRLLFELFDYMLVSMLPCSSDRHLRCRLRPVILPPQMANYLE
jgi:hypothetical protein